MSIQHQNLVFEARGLKGPEKLVLLAYANYTDGHGYCWAGVERIADDTGVSVRTVKRIRAGLLERGLLGTKRRFNRATGEAIPNLTRLNVELLRSLKRPDRSYDDNVVEAISFTPEHDAEQPESTNPHTPPDQGTCQCGTGCDQGTCQSDAPKCQSDTDPGAKLAPVEGGAKLAPNPSVHPSSSSTTPREDDEEETELAAIAPAALIQRDVGASPEEAQRLLDAIRADPSVRSVSRYVRALVANGDMAERLRRLRNRPDTAAAPRTALCPEHTRQLPCPFCAQERSSQTAGATP